MKWDNEAGLPVLCTYQGENRQLERLFLSGMYHSQLDSNPVFSYMPCNNQQGNRYYMPATTNTHKHLKHP